MRSSGTAVDMVTGRPLGEARGRKQPGKAQQEIMENRAAKLPLFESEAVVMLSGMIEKRLYPRIVKVLQDDPVAVECMAILKEMGIQKDYAAKAVALLRERKI